MAGHVGRMLVRCGVRVWGLWLRDGGGEVSRHGRQEFGSRGKLTVVLEESLKRTAGLRSECGNSPGGGGTRDCYDGL